MKNTKHITPTTRTIKPLRKLAFGSESILGPGSHHIHDGERAGAPIRHVEEALQSGRVKNLVDVLDAKLGAGWGGRWRESYG